MNNHAWRVDERPEPRPGKSWRLQRDGKPDAFYRSYYAAHSAASVSAVPFRIIPPAGEA